MIQSPMLASARPDALHRLTKYTASHVEKGPMIDPAKAQVRKRRGVMYVAH